MPMARLDELEQLLSALQRVVTYQLFVAVNHLIEFSVKQGMQHHQNHTCADNTCSTMLSEHLLKEHMHKHSRQLLSFSSAAASHSAPSWRVDVG